MVTAATRAQLHRVNDPDGMLVLLEITDPSIDDLFLVNDTRDWTIGSAEYLGLPFRFKLPQDAQGQAQRAALEIDNVGRAVVTELEKLPPGASLQATVKIVSRARPEQVDYEFTAPLSNVTATMTVVQATIGNDDALRSPAVKVRADPTLRPGLFAG